jgi:hypothetical protein
MKTHPLRDLELFSGNSEGEQRPPRKPHWSFDPAARTPGSRPPRTALEPKRQPSAEWSPRQPSKGYPAAKQQGVGVTGLQPTQTVKRFKCMVIDKVTHEPVEVLAKLITNTLVAEAYGKTTELFRKTNRGHSILDLRDGKRKSKQFVFDELSRMLGSERGEQAYRTLCSA